MLHDIYDSIKKLAYEIVEETGGRTSSDIIIDRWIKEIAVLLKADRCYIFEQEHETWKRTFGWQKENINSAGEELQKLLSDHIEDWKSQFLKGECVIIRDTEEIKETSPEIYRVLKSLHTHSMILCPLLQREGLRGIYGVDNPSAKDMESLSEIIKFLSPFVILALQRRRLVDLSYEDHLTNLYNRRALYRDIEILNVTDGIGAVYCDINGLKKINSNHGHNAGDRTLVDIAFCIKKAFQGSLAYRCGGDEFIILCNGVEQEAFNQMVLQLDQMAAEMGLSLSIGCHFKTGACEADGIEQVINNAEEDMYHIKSSYYQEMQAPVDGEYKRNYYCGQFSETVHFKNYYQIPSSQQRVIEDLLKSNGGVGIIAGYFDEDLTLCYVSNLALNILEFNSYYELNKKYDGRMMNLFSPENRGRFRKYLEAGINEIWDVTVIGANDLPIEVKIQSRTIIDEKGDRIWIIALRRLLVENESLTQTSMDRNQILIADDIEINRDYLRFVLSETNYHVLEAKDGKEALDITKQYSDSLACILLDLNMPEKDGFAVLRELNKIGLSREIPVIVITSDRDHRIEETCLKLGAIDFVTKPFIKSMVNLRIDNAITLFSKKNYLERLVQEKTLDLRNALSRQQQLSNTLKEENEIIIDMLGTVVEYRDTESGEHIGRVKRYTKILGRHYLELFPDSNLTPERVETIALASPLHDIGKIAISDAILLKPGRLTAEEFEIMKTHTIKGGELLKRINGVWNHEDPEYEEIAYQICMYHHEKYDGSGYPKGLKGEEIPLCAQLVSVADIYDALVNERCYKDPFTPQEAFHMIVSGQCGQFSERILAAFTHARDVFEKVCQTSGHDTVIHTTRSHRLKAPADILAKVNRINHIGIWSMELVEGEEYRLYLDENMEEMLGMDPSLSPEEAYQVWYDGVLEEDLPRALQYLNDIKKYGESKIEYTWNHPTLGPICVQCEGTLDYGLVEGDRYIGSHRHIYKKEGEAKC